MAENTMKCIKKQFFFHTLDAMKFEKWLAVTIMNIQDIRSSFISYFSMP